MNFECICVEKNCPNHGKDNGKLHHLTINDILLNDLKPSDNIFRYYHPKRSLEPERLKSIYQSAYLFTLLYNYTKDIEQNKNDDKQKDASTDTNTDKIKEKVLEYLFKNRDSKIENAENQLTNDEPIWDSNEIKKLRNASDLVKYENINLKCKIRVVEQENIELRTKIENIMQNLNTLNDEKHNYNSVNERLNIRIREIEKEIEKNAKTIEALRSDNKIYFEKFKAERKQVELLSNENMKMELQLSQYENIIKTIKNEISLNFNLLIDKLKIENEKELKKMVEVIQNLEAELESEKKQRSKAENALKHLRSHFMSNMLPEQKSKLDDSKIKMF